MQSTLLIGRYDWEPEKLPKDEYQERIRALWNAVPDQSCVGLAVYGDRRANGELAYVSNMIPKLRDGLALIPRSGEPKVLMSGGPNAMVPAVHQTWMKVEPLSDVAKDVAKFKQTLGGEVAVVGVDGVRMGMHEALAGVASEQLSSQAAAALRALMQKKRPRELAAMREACGMLGAAVERLAAAKPKSVTAAMADAEHAAIRMGAQDVRSLFSTDGGKVLRPFLTPIEAPADPLQAYFAIRHLGYWVEGYVRLGTNSAAAEKAGAALKAAIAKMKPGAKAGEVAAAAAGSHPVTAASAGNSIGLSLEEEPRFIAASAAALQAGGVYTVRAGASEGKDHAIASAMVAVTDRGSERLWPAD
jgi:Xaa-Pro aminopeptidase